MDPLSIVMDPHATQRFEPKTEITIVQASVERTTKWLTFCFPSRNASPVASRVSTEAGTTQHSTLAVLFRKGRDRDIIASIKHKTARPPTSWQEESDRPSAGCDTSSTAAAMRGSRQRCPPGAPRSPGTPLLWMWIAIGALLVSSAFSLISALQQEPPSILQQWTRREAFAKLITPAGTLLVLSPLLVSAASARTTSSSSSSSSITTATSTFDKEAAAVGSAGLVYETILGRGSFKTVYRVRDVVISNNNTSQQYYALAVQKLRTKADVQDGWRGIQMVERLQQQQQQSFSNGGADRNVLESVEAWWFQTQPPAAFVPEGPVFFSSSKNDRTQQKPTGSFRGTKWLIAIKPLYDMDLTTFCKLAPLRYTVGGTGESRTSATTETPTVVAGLPLTDEGARQLAREMLHAGTILHNDDNPDNIVLHRDVKPQNIMLHDGGHALLIDFGFAVSLDKKHGECREQPGVVKGDLPYVLARDVALYRACRAGDCYAMGKTLYEVLFEETTAGSSSYSQRRRQPITVALAQQQNADFWALLVEAAPSKSRFALSPSTRDALWEVIRGLCRQVDPLSFAEAEELLLASLATNPHTSW